MQRSPCVGCQDRKPEYECVDRCKRPAEYARGFGNMNESMPIHLTTWGRDFSPPPKPLIPAIFGSGSCVRSPYTPVRENKCRYYGCTNLVPEKASFCAWCNVRVRNRMGQRGKVMKPWPDRFLYAPADSKLVFLIKQEPVGRIRLLPWYIAAQEDSRAGVFRRMQIQKRDLIGDIKKAGFETIEEALNTLYPRLRSSREVGKILGLSCKTVIKYLKTYHIPVLEMGGANRPLSETFMGMCRRHGETARYAKSGGCVLCSKESNARQALKQKAPPREGLLAE